MSETVAVLLLWEDTCSPPREGMPRAVRKTTQEIEKRSKACQPAVESNVLYTGFFPHRRCRDILPCSGLFTQYRCRP